jgi:predicted signal transduction protein with EAL and GGDEF domain
VVANADLALYQAKADGGDARRMFTASMRQAALARRQHDVEIRRAIENMELELFYQPQVRLSDGALTGAEALLRWRHPERGVLAGCVYSRSRRRIACRHRWRMGVGDRLPPGGEME